jgi:hypothetical protein
MAGAAEATLAAMTRIEIIDDVKRHLHHWNHYQLRQAIERV